MVVENYKNTDTFENVVLSGSLTPLWCLNWRVTSWDWRRTWKAHLALLPLRASFLHYGPLWIPFQLACAQPWEPELEWALPPDLWEDARPIISWPHSWWLDSCSPRPVVSIGSAHEAMAARRQQQQYTERAKYTEDSSITCTTKPELYNVISVIMLCL